MLSSEYVGLLSGDTLQDLTLFVHIELGWIGLLYGAQFEWRILRRQPVVNWWIMSVESLFSMLAVFFSAWILLFIWQGFRGMYVLPAVIILSVAASLSSPWTVGIIYQILKVRTPLIRRLQNIVVIDDIPGLLVFSAMFAILGGGGPDLVILRGMGSIFTGLVLGFIVVLMLRRRDEWFEPMIVLLGVVLLAAGIALKTGMPVITVTLVTGVIIANSRSTQRNIYNIIASSEHVLYLLFLILAGAFWDPTDIFALVTAVLLALTRIAAKWWAFEISKRYLSLKDWGGHLSLALVSPGGIAVAMVVNFTLFADQFPLTQFVLNVTVWALIILNPLGITFARKVLLADKRSE